MLRKRSALLVLATIVALIVPTAALAGNGNGTSGDAAHVTVLHTNDFHGRLETDYKARGGSAYMAAIIDDIRSTVGPENVALVDAGDVFFAAPAVSQLLMGESTIDIYNMMGYDAAAFGNHEFDKGQEELMARVAQSDFPWLGANVVLEGTDWDLPDWAQPYEILEVGGVKTVRGDGRAVYVLEPERAAELAQVESELRALTRAERVRMLEQITDEIVGLGPLEPLLRDESITEVMVNGPRQVYIERAGRLELTNISFQNDDHVMRIIDRIISPIGRRVDESSPMVDARPGEKTSWRSGTREESDMVLPGNLVGLLG